jgi:hypothetical protein
MTVQQWSTTAANNNSSPPTGAPEGQTPGSVNNVMREMMASVAIEAQINRIKNLDSVAGTNTITASMTPALTAYSAGMLVVLTPANNNTGATTLNINSLGALDVQKYDAEALVTGDLRSGVPAVLVLDSGADDWILLNPQSQITTSPNTDASEFGFKGLPQNERSGDYTCVLTDAGKHIHAVAGVSTITIPANASVAYPLGTVLTFINRSGGNISIAITTDAMTLAATSATGTRTLANNGIAAAVKTVTAGWLISGTGLS